MNKTQPFKSSQKARLVACSLFVLLYSLVNTALAKATHEIVKVQVTVKDAYGKEIKQDITVTVFVDSDTPSPRPIAIIGHGRASRPEQRANMGRVGYTVVSNWLASVGFAVAVPTRVGYGVSAGEDVEDSGDCRNKRYPPAYDAAAVQTLQVLNYMRERPDTIKDRSAIIGQSFGGTTSITVAAKNPPGVLVAINFAGGGGGDAETHPKQPCGVNRLERLFANYGETARIPTLWIYTENDLWMGNKYPREWFDAFKAAGGVGEFIQFPPNGEDGHGLFGRAPEVWRSKVMEFMRANGYPEIK